MIKSKNLFRVIVLLSLPIIVSDVASAVLPATSVRKGWYWENFRFGVGAGNAFYLTNQMDNVITRNYGVFDEIRPTSILAIYKAINEDWEIGLNYRSGGMQTLKSEYTQGSQCNFNEIQFIIAYSFNHNINLTNSRFTANGQLGLGGNYFKSRYFEVYQDNKAIGTYFSTVGYNGVLKGSKNQNEKQAAIIGNFGITLGFKLLKNLSVYWENNVNISTSNKMSGNLHKRSWIPPDGYFFTGIGLFINITPSRGRLSCPKF